MWLAAASTASATASGCNETQRGCACTTGECRFARSIAADEGAWIFCLHNPPLSPLHVSGSALFAFGEAEITYSGKAEVHKASEDTEFLDLTRTTSAEARAREWCRHVEEVKSSWSSLLPSWSADKRTDRYSFSPHYHSCLAVCPRGEAADVQVSFRRHSPFERDRARRPSAYESGAAALLVGLLLLASAGYLARSTAFHYGFGIGAWMALGVALVAVLLIQRTTSGRKGATLSAAAFLGWGGWLLRWGKDYLLSLWTSYSRWVLAYLAFFGVVGYAWTFWQLRGGRLEPWKAGLLERLLRLGACGLLLCAFHSARVCLAVLLIAFAVKFAPTGLGSSLQPWLAREVPPAPPPPAYRDRYLTEEEYRLQGQLTTDRELQALFASPEGRRWLTAAAGDGRLRVGPREGSGGGGGGGGDSSDEDD